MCRGASGVTKKAPLIEAAERRVQAALPMPHVAVAAGPDARVKWHDPELTPLEVKRDIIRSLVRVTILSAAGKQPGVRCTRWRGLYCWRPLADGGRN